MEKEAIEKVQKGGNSRTQTLSRHNQPGPPPKI